MRHNYIAMLPLLAGALGSCSHLDDVHREDVAALPHDAGVSQDAGRDAGYAGKDAGQDGGMDAGKVDAGQDAGRDAGPDAGRYSYSYDGMVYDSTTRLYWQRRIVDQKPGCTAGVWTGTTHNACTWQEAYNYCDNLVLAGYGGFRLPTQWELRTILASSSISPTIDSFAFPGTYPTNYWTSTPSTSGSYYVVDFQYAIDRSELASHGWHVRCVSSSQ